ncbi:MAG: P1 family peptidase [Candidatus Odinarchaeota archaeon]
MDNFLVNHGIKLGSFERGKTNSIADVTGVRVSHVTVTDGGSINTGVTAVMPGEKNPFTARPLANFAVFNGYGKSTGLVQVKELGELETPIVLTNTLSTWTAADALIEWLIQRFQEEGYEKEVLSVNPVVFECNDGYLNDITGKHVTKEHVMTCLDKAWFGKNNENFLRGATGAGKGMSAFELKGGIGSSSRILDLNGQTCTLGCLCLTNYGKLEQLIINGKNMSSAIRERLCKEPEACDHDGSVIVILATDASLDYRQLGRVTRRVIHGLAKTGSISSHGSGDIALAFSTASRIENKTIIKETSLSTFFQATVDLVEEAVLDSLVEAETTIGRENRIRHQIPTDLVLKTFL